MTNKYPITSYETVFLIFGIRLIKITNYRFLVEKNVKPKDYKKEIGSIKYEIKFFNA